MKLLQKVQYARFTCLSLFISIRFFIMFNFYRKESSVLAQLHVNCPSGQVLTANLISHHQSIIREFNEWIFCIFFETLGLDDEVVLLCEILNVFDKLADLRSKPCAHLFTDLDKSRLKLFCFDFRKFF